jgi:hypothetical protein
MKILLMLGLLLLPSVALAQTYRWVDETGGVHYSGNRDSIPEKYRATAVPLGAPAPRVPPAGAVPAAPGPPASRLGNLPPGQLPSKTRIAPGPEPGYWEISHPQGFLLKFADRAKCQETAEKISQTFKRTVSCYERND